jgi:hypothetical protein
MAIKMGDMMKVLLLAILLISVLYIAIGCSKAPSDDAAKAATENSTDTHAATTAPMN